MDDKMSSSPPSEDPLLDSITPIFAMQSSSQSTNAALNVPVSKRNACTACRRRKMKCDGEMPACGNCIRLMHQCSYVKTRKKSGPRRGYVKALEKRLAEMEVLLKQHGEGSSTLIIENAYEEDVLQEIEVDASVTYQNSQPSSMVTVPEFETMPEMSFFAPIDQSFYNEDIMWSMIEVGVQEPLPPLEAIDELTNIYFTKVHPTIPIINQYRFQAAMHFSSNSRPPISLRYAMWALAASVTNKYKPMHSHFYTRARKYAEMDETSGREKYVNIRHCQAWMLIATYAFKMALFPHAFLTTGRATRLAQMLGLYQMDGSRLTAKQTLVSPGDICEREERRRTFWMAYCMDRYSGVGTGWPWIIDERDIVAFLPVSEEEFELNLEGPTITLKEAMIPTHAAFLSPFAAKVVMASLKGRIQTHLNRPPPSSDPKEASAAFWKSHREIDNILLNMAMHLPPHLRIPAGSSNPNIIHMNQGLHSCIIIIHQAAIARSKELPHSEEVKVDSWGRCLAAAKEISSIMKKVAHLDLSTALSVFTPFALSIPTRIFAQQAKSHPDDDEAASQLRFLLSALIALKETSPLAEIYLIQLDFEGYWLASLRKNIGDMGTMSGFEQMRQGVAEVSLRDDPEDESLWYKYISPIVRIAEQTEEIRPISPQASASNNDLRGKGPAVVSSAEFIRDAPLESELSVIPEDWTLDIGTGVHDYGVFVDFGNQT